MLYDPKWKKLPGDVRPAKVFRAAADAIQKRGQSRGILVDDKGRMCLWGAISFVMHNDPCHGSKKSHDLLEKLRPFTGGEDPVYWNNKATRTKRQVVNMLRKAADEV